MRNQRSSTFVEDQDAYQKKKDRTKSYQFLVNIFKGGHVAIKHHDPKTSSWQHAWKTP